MANVVKGQLADSTAPEHREIPDKLYFRIGEVSRIVGVKPYVLRFWESQFPTLAPKKSGTGHRLYRRKEVEMLLQVHDLLHRQRYTIEGARKYLETRGRSNRAAATPAPVAMPAPQQELFPEGMVSLDHIRAELRAILALLEAKNS